MLTAHPIPQSRVLDLPTPHGVHSGPSWPRFRKKHPPSPGLEDKGWKRRGEGGHPLCPRGSSTYAFDINTHGNPQTHLRHPFSGKECAQVTGSRGPQLESESQQATLSPAAQATPGGYVFPRKTFYSVIKFSITVNILQNFR